MGLPSLHQVNILGTCLGVVATLMTVWRLVYRWRDHKLWWDDAWALIAMVNAWILVSCVWVIFAPEGITVTQHARVVTFYLLEECFTFAIWSARLSILFTIIRITPGRFVRQALHVLAVIFAVFAVVLGAQKFWVCVPQPGWTDVPGATCNLGKQVALSEIITDVIGDIILVVIPVRLLWNIKVTKSLRIRLITVFSMSLVTTTVSLCQNYYLIHDGGVRDFIVSHVEIETAVTVCNLNVLVAALYRYMHKAELEETNDTKSPSTRCPSTHVSFAAASRNARVRSLPAGHPCVLGPPLAIAAGGLTTGGPLGGLGVDGGIRVHKETTTWTHSRQFDAKDANSFSESLKDLPSTLDLEDSEDDRSELDTPRRKEHHLSFDRDLERGESYPMRNFSRPIPSAESAASNSSSSAKVNEDL